MLAAVSVSFETFAARNFAGIPISSVVPRIRFAVMSSVPVVPAETCRSAHVSVVVDVPVSCARVRRPAEAVNDPMTFVVSTVPDSVAPRTARAQEQGSASLWEDGHGAARWTLRGRCVGRVATTLEPESPLEPPERLIATGEPVTLIAVPYDGINATGG